MTAPKRYVVTLCMAALAASSCRRHRAEVIVFHATSLTQALGDAAEVFQEEHPSVRVRLEPSGSQVAARKVAELGMAADVVMLADGAILERALVPQHASYLITMATGEMVIAHKDHSRFTDELSSDNWTEILSRADVRLGRVNPDTAPIGYQTVLVWQLAERQRSLAAPLFENLRSKIDPAHVVTDEAELIALLESRAIDYAFLYRSTAEDHHLKITTLPVTQNLSSLELAATYATVGLDVRMQLGGDAMSIRGAPITYGLTILTRAPHPAEATQWAAFLLSARGRRIFERRGLLPLAPARCDPCAGVPAELAGLVSSAR